MHHGTLKSYAIGFGFSLILTLAAYFAATAHLFGKLGMDLTISGLALLQAWLFLYLYLDLGKEGKPHWNLTVFLFMVMVTVLLVVGTIWIMYHLNYNLMPKA